MKDKIKVISIESFDRHTSVFVSINGIVFQRLQDHYCNYPPVWNDVHAHFGQIDLCSKEKEKELEAIFQALKPQLQNHFSLQTQNA